MSNLLPANKKEDIKKILVTRLIAAFFAWLSFAFLLTFIAFFVVYALFNASILWQKQSLDTLNTMVEQRSINSNTAELSALYNIAQTATSRHEILISDAILHFVSIVNNTVKIKDMTLSYLSSDEKQKTDFNNKILITANLASESKESIMELIRNLQNSKRFEDLDINKILSSLKADSSGVIHFNLNLTYIK